MKTLSIIIPTYNMEDYLPRCLDSLLAEGVLDQLEVWIVNDGSRDRSSEIAHQYESRYPGVFNVIDKENGNYGSCINVALPLCTGKYVKILDADDWFETANLSQFISDLQATDVDMVYTDFVRTDEQKAPRCLFPPREVASEVPEGKNCIMMHAISYRTCFIQSIDYHQTEEISYTDAEWVLYPNFYAKKYIYFDYVIYHYCYGREGQTMDFNIKKERSSHLYQIAVRMLKYYIAYDKSVLHKHTHDYIKHNISFFNEQVYKNYLLFNTITEETINLLSDLDVLIREADIEKQVNDLRIPVFGFQVKYVKIYRCYGLRAFNLFLIIYNLRVRLKNSSLST